MPESIINELNQAKKFIFDGKLDEAEQILDYLEKREELEDNDRLKCHILRLRLLNTKDQYESALKLADTMLQNLDDNLSLQKVDILILKAEAFWDLESFDKCIEVADQAENMLQLLKEEPKSEIIERKAFLLNIKGGASLYEGELNRCWEYNKTALALFEQIEHKEGIARVFTILAAFHMFKGELNEARIHFEKSLALKKEIGNKIEIAGTLTNLGTLYMQKKELDRALEYYYQSLALQNQTGNSKAYGMSLNNIARIHTEKGNFNLGLKYLERSLQIHKANDDKSNLVHSLWGLGEIYAEQGKLDKALDYLEQCLDLQEEIGMFNPIVIANIFFQLISVNIDRKAINEARNYLTRLQEINKEAKNKIISQTSHISEALILKTSSRARNRGKAEELLERVIEEDITLYELTIIALLNLCDLLLTELRISGDTEVLIEIQKRITQLFDIAQQRNSPWLLAETYVIKAKLALLELNVQQAEEFLEKAKKIAEEEKLRKTLDKITKEQTSFQEQIEKWGVLIERNAPMSERLELTQLEELVSRMARKRVMTREEDVISYAEDVEKLMAMWEEIE